MCDPKDEQTDQNYEIKCIFFFFCVDKRYYLVKYGQKVQFIHKFDFLYIYIYKNKTAYKELLNIFNVKETNKWGLTGVN